MENLKLPYWVKCAVLTVGLTNRQIAELKRLLPPDTIVNQMTDAQRYCRYPRKQLLNRYSLHHCVIINPHTLSDDSLRHILPTPEEYGAKQHIPMLLLTEERAAFPDIPAAFDAATGQPTRKLRCAIDLLERIRLSFCHDMKDRLEKKP